MQSEARPQPYFPMSVSVDCCDDEGLSLLADG